MRISLSPKDRRVCALSALGVALLISSSCASLAERFGGQAKAANEISAIASLRAIAAAQTNYSVQHGQYAASLEALGSLIPADLTAGEKSGYRFTLKGSQSEFAATAVPTTPGSSGDRSFFEDATLVIRESTGPNPATADSPDIEKRLGK
jgi:hypothetical protein